MTKRFVDTEIWQKEWFQNLSLKHKVLLKYIFENCDCAGFWEFNFRMASFIIGENITIDDIKEINKIKKQFEILDNKLYICDFIKFQYGKLSYACKPHLPVIKLLEKNGIEFEILDENNLTIKQMRKRLTETAKKQIFIRDKFECQYCGSKEDLEIDHIIPLSQGGNNEDSNLITACHRCNSLKGDKKLKDFLENNREIDFLDRVSKILETLEEKEQEKEKEKEKENLSFLASSFLSENQNQKEEKQPPSKEEILLYANSIAKKFNVDDFISYWQATAWKDKNGLPVNWKQKVISWANREFPKTPPLESTKEKKSPYLSAEQSAKQLAEYRNMRGDPMSESFKNFGAKLRGAEENELCQES